MFICKETLWLQLWHGPTLVNTSVPFNEIICDPAVFVIDLRSAVRQHGKNLDRYLYREIWQTDQIFWKIVMFPRKDLSSKISVCLMFFFQLLFLFKCQKNTNIVPFLLCLYLSQSVNSVVLTPLHGLGKLSLQRTAIPHSITGPFRSAHRELLAEKLCWYSFQQASGENEAASQKTWIITHSTTSRHHIVVEGSACPDDPWRRAAGGGWLRGQDSIQGRRTASPTPFPPWPRPGLVDEGETNQKNPRLGFHAGWSNCFKHLCSL